jgi:hypothetical protein
VAVVGLACAGRVARVALVGERGVAATGVVVASPMPNAPEKVSPAMAPPAIPAPATIAISTVATRIRPPASVRCPVVRIRRRQAIRSSSRSDRNTGSMG